MSKTKAKPMSDELPIKTSDGLTVRELKDWLANVPDVASDGQPAQVWMQMDDALESAAVTLLGSMSIANVGWHVIIGRV